MSTIDVQNINSKTGNSAITISDAGTVSAGGNEVVTTQSAQLGRRNLIINGAMQVAQRGTSTTGVTTSGYFTCDRFDTIFLTLGTWTVEQSTDAPSGFSNSYKLTCTTADASPSTGDYAQIRYKPEGQDLQQLAYGTSSAKTMTLSFWVKSNKTGDASFEIIQDDNSNKLFSNSYTINAADTWEYKSINIPADTSGVIDNDNGVGLYLAWWLNSGSDFYGGSLATVWQTYDATARNVSNLGVGGATSDYFAITGVQLEVGDTATPFEHRSYGEELALCQRYYEKSWGDTIAVPTTTDDGSHIYTGTTQGSGIFFGTVQFTTAKRAAPSVTYYNLASTSGQWYYERSGASGNKTAIAQSASTQNVRLRVESIGANWAAVLVAGHYVADAEL